MKKKTIIDLHTEFDEITIKTSVLKAKKEALIEEKGLYLATIPLDRRDIKKVKRYLEKHFDSKINNINRHIVEYQNQGIKLFDDYISLHLVGDEIISILGEEWILDKEVYPINRKLIDRGQTKVIRHYMARVLLVNTKTNVKITIAEQEFGLGVTPQNRKKVANEYVQDLMNQFHSTDWVKEYFSELFHNAGIPSYKKATFPRLFDLVINFFTEYDQKMMSKKSNRI